MAALFTTRFYNAIRMSVRDQQHINITSRREKPNALQHLPIRANREARLRSDSSIGAVLATAAPTAASNSNLASTNIEQMLVTDQQQ